MLTACVFVTQDTVRHPRRFVFGKFVCKPNCSWSEAFVNRGLTVQRITFIAVCLLFHFAYGCSKQVVIKKWLWWIIDIYLFYNNIKYFKSQARNCSLFTMKCDWIKYVLSFCLQFSLCFFYYDLFLGLYFLSFSWPVCIFFLYGFCPSIFHTLSLQLYVCFFPFNCILLNHFGFGDSHLKNYFLLGSLCMKMNFSLRGWQKLLLLLLRWPKLMWTSRGKCAPCYNTWNHYTAHVGCLTAWFHCWKCLLWHPIKTTLSHC